MLVVKNLPANAGDIREAGSVPGSGRSPGAGHGNLLQYSCLENPMDRGAWQATVHRVARSQTQLKWLHTHAHQEDTSILTWFSYLILGQPPGLSLSQLSLLHMEAFGILWVSSFATLTCGRWEWASLHPLAPHMPHTTHHSYSGTMRWPDFKHFCPRLSGLLSLQPQSVVQGGDASTSSLSTLQMTPWDAWRKSDECKGREEHIRWHATFHSATV